MRRDVRLLGDILGEVIRDSDPKTGPDLLADVERLRHAVIEARYRAREDAGEAGDAIAALVASWDLDRAEQVARAFTVYFHLANLAEEHQRIRMLRARDTGQQLVRESLGAAVAELGHDVGPWCRRCGGSASCSTCWTTRGRAPPTGPKRGASCTRTSTCCGGHHSC